MKRQACKGTSVEPENNPAGSALLAGHTLEGRFLKRRFAAQSLHCQVSPKQAVNQAGPKRAARLRELFVWRRVQLKELRPRSRLGFIAVLASGVDRALFEVV